MSISPFFQHLRSAYEAELDDLASDSEGTHVLPRKLAERRKELGFLLSMLELSPEMVAVVFHQAFRFKSPAALNDLLSYESEELPEWTDLSDSIEIAPWARALAEQVLKQPAGPWFMCVAAALEYMYGRADTRPATTHDGDEEEEDRDTDAEGGGHEGLDEDEREARVSEEEGAAWMVEQGFDHKD